MKRWWWMSFALAGAGCGETAELTPAPMPVEMPPVRMHSDALDWVTEARVQYPRFIDVEKKVIARTCSPNPGVCHQTNNYPDMHTAGNVLALLGARCNLEIPDPHQGWDGCEPHGDRVLIGDVAKELAWIEKAGGGAWRAALREPASDSMQLPLSLFDEKQAPFFDPPAEWAVNVSLTAGSSEIQIRTEAMDPYVVDFVDSILATAVGGDANRNGVYGADDPALGGGAVIAPGDLAKSYLWGRVTGTVPGTRMPLANQPLSNAEYVALACWIEGLDPDGEPAALALIDYDACAYAKDPVKYAPF